MLLDDLQTTLIPSGSRAGSAGGTPEEITKTIATFISQDGALDVRGASNKCLCGLTTSFGHGGAVCWSRWKKALGVSTPANSLTPVDGSLTEGNLGVGSVSGRKTSLRERLLGNPGTTSGARYGVMSLKRARVALRGGCARTNPFDIDGLGVGGHLRGGRLRDAVGREREPRGWGGVRGGCHWVFQYPGRARPGEPTLDLPQACF